MNVIHLDDFSGEKFIDKYRKVADFIRNKHEPTVEGIFHTVEGRKLLLDACRNERNTCIWLDTDHEIIALRASHGYSKDRDFVQPANFQPPDYSEGWDEIIIIRNNQPMIN